MLILRSRFQKKINFIGTNIEILDSDEKDFNL